MSTSCARSPAPRGPRACPSRSSASSTRRSRARSATRESLVRSTSKFRPTCCARRCRRSSCSTNGWQRSRRAVLPPDPALIADGRRCVLVGAASARHHRPGRARGGRGAGPLPRPHRRALPRYAGEPRAGARRPSFDRGRRARRGDDGGGCRAAHRPQARLSGRLRLAGGLPECALHPPRRQSRRADRQPPRPAGIARLAALSRSTRCSRRRATASRRSTRRGPTGFAHRHRERAAPARTRPATGPDGKIHPQRDLRCDRRGRRRGLHRRRRRRRSPELRADRAARVHLHGCRRLRLPRRRRAVRDRRRSRHAGAAGHLRQRRWRLRHQRDGDRHRRPPRREGASSSSPTMPPGTSSGWTRR